MTTESRPRVGWDFLLKWVVAQIVGSLFGFLLLSGAVGILKDILTTPVPIGIIILSALAGFVYGIAQGAALLSIIGRAERWILFTMIGYTIGLSASLILKVDQIFLLLFAGLTIGVTQWIVLKTLVKRAEIWILINIVVSVIPSGLITLLLTGITLRWLLNQPLEEIDQSTSSVTSV